MCILSDYFQSIVSLFSERNCLCPRWHAVLTNWELHSEVNLSKQTLIKQHINLKSAPSHIYISQKAECAAVFACGCVKRVSVCLASVCCVWACAVCCVSLDSDVVEDEYREEQPGTLERTFSFLRKISIRRSKVTPKVKEQRRCQALSRIFQQVLFLSSVWDFLIFMIILCRPLFYIILK